ncbi:MAG: hypothetical protein RLZZ272_196 [Actinomycetota bacterium]
MLVVDHLVLHIGRHKTGTTAIQWHLVEHAFPGMCYPRSGRVRPDGRVQPGHHTLARTLQDPSAELSGDLRRIRRGIRWEARRSEMLVLSSEGFQNLDRSGIERVERFVASLRPDRFTIVCYLREYLSYAISAFQQSAQSNPGVHDFVAYAEGVGDIDLLASVAEWRRIGDVVLRPYDRSLLDAGDAVTDFLGILGRRPAIDPASVADRNPSISGNLLLTKLVLNQADWPRLPDYNALRKCASADDRFRGPFRVGDSDAEALRARSRFARGVLELFPDLPVPSFAGGRPVPDMARLEEDLATLASPLRLRPDAVTFVREQAHRVEPWLAPSVRDAG